MLSAAAAALLTAGLAAARADTEISTSTSTPLTTASAGNILIDSTGAVAIQTSSTAAVVLNSANAVVNNGTIANTGVDSAIGVQIDTSGGSIFAPSSGFASTGTIDVSGNGASKNGILISGGNTFYGSISLTSLTTTQLTGGAFTSQTSSLLTKGDTSSAFYLVQGTSVTSNILIGGGGIAQAASDGSTASNSIIVFLDGTLNGNFVNTATIAGTGPGMIGVETLGGLHACASDTAAPSGFSCPTGSTGALINIGTISLTGITYPSSRGNNPEASSALVIGNSVDGGILNAGSGTSASVTAATIASAGIVASGVTNSTVLIDPSRSETVLTVPRGPINIGPLTNAIDTIDPGYSFINRGSITARPIDTSLSAAAIIIQGVSSTYYTCLSASVGACTGVNATNPQLNTGGFLNTGTIAVNPTTGISDRTGTTPVSASGVYIGAFATIPRFDVKAETISGTTTTPGVISAQVSGVGEGSAFGVNIGTGATVPVINVGKGATIFAGVTTSTVSPTKDFAIAADPFSLVGEAIVDQSNTLKLINNAGTIQAANTTLTPATGAVTLNVQRALDLQTNTTGGITLNNSGKVLGDVLLGAAGNGDTINVGNIGASSTANPATGVANTAASYAVIAESIVSNNGNLPPTTLAGLIDFGSGINQTLHVGSYGYVNAVINDSSAGAVAVQVDSGGVLFVANTANSLQASTVVASANATLGLSIAQANLNSLNPVVQANSANLSGANLALAFGTFISSGVTAASTTSPTTQTVTLVRAPTIIDTTLANQNALLGQNTPFLFESPASAGIVPATSTYKADNGPTPLSLGTSGGQQTLLLNLLPRSTGATNADGSPGLNLTGDARNQFPFVASALATDNELGAAIASSLTVYNTPGLPSSGINVAASQQQAQQAFTQFGPDVSGGTREIAIMLTDQATGPVAARQRLLRSYGKVAGDMTLWGEEFAGHINNKGAVAGSGALTSYKDHGYGFSLGLDAGSPRNGWYGGAFTFYSGDVSQLTPRATKTQTEWYMLTGYTNWEGRRVFFDSHLDVAYGNFTENRGISEGGITRLASSKRPGVMAALGVNGGVMYRLGAFELDPHVSLDGLTLREEGYNESGGGTGFNLDVAPYFANSMRTAIGTDLKGTIAAFGIDLTPEARIGYRYELLHQPVKIRAAFDSTGGLGTTGNTMTFIGPDPDKGDVVGGLSLGAGTDTWHLGVNYDWVRGNNGSTTQVGTLTVLGRI